MARKSGAKAITLRQWDRLTDAQLLELRICDLPIRIEGSWLEPMVDRLQEELWNHKLHVKPNVWLSSEWFAPDGIVGIGIPFYLADPKLMRLEKKMMFSVEGGTPRTCMQILRHEAGHAVDNAFRLHRRKLWRETFGSHAEPYPDYYKPRPNSRKFVHHLRGWYAQAHPAEDFAETFAVWLTPNSRWRKAYSDWPALKKLECVHALMKDVAGKAPPVKSKRRIDPIETDKRTLEAYYRERQMRYLEDWPDVEDEELNRLFTEDYDPNRPTAAQFLRRVQQRLRENVAYWTNVHPYTIDQVLLDTIDRCKELQLRLAKSEKETFHDATLLLTVRTMNFIHTAHRWIPL